MVGMRGVIKSWGYPLPNLLQLGSCKQVCFSQSNEHHVCQIAALSVGGVTWSTVTAVLMCCLSAGGCGGLQERVSC